MRDKTNYEKGNIRTVECIKIDDLLKPHRNIVMRMDIEGAEYAVLRRMIDKGMLRKLLYLEVEFHSVKMNNRYRDDEASIIKAIRAAGVNFKEIPS